MSQVTLLECCHFVSQICQGPCSDVVQSRLNSTPLTPYASYHAENLLMAFMTLAFFIIDNLLKLHKDEVIYRTLAYPQGIIFDHPTMCKMCEFADHGHNQASCPKSKVKKDKKGLQMERECREYFKKCGVWWTKLAWFPYFDFVWHIIIDPMHNLFLPQ
ncbi:hypothetical protein PAXRUDRAFT_34792 [Paxillus rubicundulus Ve08.2h10]|uniref:Uncharacterized protein n=1 Tax=Paxillus rubicundulus Ve08.2h10 TaxID=930991 RepID=A0A0D0DYP0_9AGAM|nr:hypothetical protein PAXRUDRAFT_34792 [Paxillus rubicundulus Ve08.2h10]